MKLFSVPDILTPGDVVLKKYLLLFKKPEFRSLNLKNPGVVIPHPKTPTRARRVRLHPRPSRWLDVSGVSFSRNKQSADTLFI